MKLILTSIVLILITALNVSFGQETEEQSAPDSVIVIDVDPTSALDTVIHEESGLKPEPETVITMTPAVEAEFPGGHGAMNKYIAENVRYPEEALENKEQGKLILRFTIEKTGEITNIEIARGVSPSINAEGIRIVESFPTWKPAENHGYKVRSTMNIPINFQLAND
jgi:TonB family protein